MYSMHLHTFVRIRSNAIVGNSVHLIADWSSVAAVFHPPHSHKQPQANAFCCIFSSTIFTRSLPAAFRRLPL